MNLPGLRKRGKPDVPSLAEWFNRPFGSITDFLERPLEQIWQETTPAVDISENDNEVTVRAEVPGMDSKDLTLLYSQGTLTIKGERQERKEKKEKESSYEESRYGSFRRDIPLGENLRFEDAKASCKNGVLRVSIPKKEKGPKGGKKIDIE
ncbi:Hsp20/alpha crystallin family protein [Chitinispirillales bacterium ANBcel5]|uniref:Hsp20/alpha crystallin family protein n=1 Tax=Cellulosispirillum alkaliphilum TaxID=3039283 RepID=UPI002A4EE53D|nr:Hsp20/alpha crystallin family protein [Chitinispirillales bacterium ANBcel5]